jgi:hypothetical protein
MVPRRSGGIARGPLGPWPILVAMFAIAGPSGCSSSTKRDQNYGKDVGLTYEAPEGGVVDATVRDVVVDGGAGQDARADAEDAATGDGP